MKFLSLSLVVGKRNVIHSGTQVGIAQNTSSSGGGGPFERPLFARQN